jgi:hypothetical protein
MLAIWFLAFGEELLWDKAIWRERDWLFGESWELEHWQRIIVPLLAVPQLTHYILDAFIWKRSRNPEVGSALQ